MIDTLLSGGWIADGKRGVPYQADLCIRNGKIADITSHWDGEYKTRIDVSGKIVAPDLLTSTHTQMHVHFPSAFRTVRLRRGLPQRSLEIAESPPFQSFPLPKANNQPTFEKSQRSQFPNKRFVTPLSRRMPTTSVRWDTPPILGF